MEVAQKSWELDNNVKLVDPKRDALFNYDVDVQKKLNAARPWTKDPNYFKAVRISAVALIKMVMHARSGGDIEVMGLMLGYVDGNALVITDAFRLPVEGTETRVNAHESANEYMVEYLSLGRDQGRMENAVGWYHSHPGYGCWLSGIDVETQSLQQQFSEPFVAVVVDPDRTISAGKVEIGAFRTYPQGHQPADARAGGDSYQTVPMDKAQDFGAHANRYYSLEVEVYKSTLDTQLLAQLWNKYWVQTLSQSPLFTNRDYSNKQMLDLAHKIKDATANVDRVGKAGHLGYAGREGNTKMIDVAIEKATRDSKQLAANEISGLMAGQTKAKIFNGLGSDAV